ncbi:hypothetical protein [Flavobacterium beibuense]|uniref:hypothetical protein n=1 Tax=Flavobacterium beibuense TaxID=657326 RepID=UPI003A8DD5E1
MKNIKDIQLTENDFKLIDRALDTLPREGGSVELMEVMLENLIPKGKHGPHLEEGWLKFQQNHNKKREQEKEEIRLLQAKLITLKRLLKDDGSIK